MELALPAFFRRNQSEADNRPYVRKRIAESGNANHLQGSYPPMAWRLIHRADSAVLRGLGIRPILDRDAADEWSRLKVDPAQRVTVRDLQHVALAQLMLYDEAFVERVPGGRFFPLPRPDHIRFTGGRYRIPSEYVWLGRGGESPFSLPADNVIHLMLMERPFQTRGINLLEDLRPYMEERTALTLAGVKQQVLAALFGFWRKRRSGIGAAPLSGPAELDIDLDDPAKIVDISQGDELGATSAPTRPAAMREVDHLLVSAVAARAGLSKQTVTGDHTEGSYSAHLAAAVADSPVWGRYQLLILELTRLVYEEWTGRLGRQLHGWAIPHPVPSLDPAKFAMYADRLHKLGAISLFEIIAMDARDPMETMRLLRLEKEQDEPMEDEDATEED